MARDKLIEYDQTAANNTVIGDVNTSETMLPSEVNDAFRELASHLKEFADGTSGINALSLTDDTDTNAIKFQAPASVTATTTFTLPDGDGTSGQAIITDGAGTLTWGDAGGGSNVFTLFEFTATAGQTTFTGADDNAATLAYGAGKIIVTMNGVTLDPSDYTASNGTSLVLASGAAVGDIVNIYAFSTFSVADTVAASTGGTFSGNITAPSFQTTATKMHTAVFRTNEQTVTQNTTIATAENALAIGPLTIDPSATITVDGNLTIL